MELKKFVFIIVSILCIVCYVQTQEVNVSRIVPVNYDAQMRPGNPLEGK